MIQHIALITLLVSCPKTKIVNETKAWIKADDSALKDTKNRCKIYYSDAPCLKVFIKKEENVYRAICGK